MVGHTAELVGLAGWKSSTGYAVLWVTEDDSGADKRRIDVMLHSIVGNATTLRVSTECDLGLQRKMVVSK